MISHSQNNEEKKTKKEKETLQFQSLFTRAFFGIFKNIHLQLNL